MSLVFERLSKSYPDGTMALDEVAFEVPRGQLCVVLGPSGSGKSTLLRMVNGLAMPTAGRLLVGGVPVEPRTLRKLRPGIGMIHQAFGLVGRSSVLTNVLSGALPMVPAWRAWLGMFPEPYRRKACRLIAEVGLGEEHLCRRADHLSGGQQQRVGIARAFMLDPAYVLADEPVASLDPHTSQTIMALLVAKARRSGATLLCSLHQLDLALRFADRILALNAGQIVYDGPPAALGEQMVARIYGESAAVLARAVCA